MTEPGVPEDASKSGSRATPAAFGVVLCVAAAVRLWNLDWGLPYALMPDETMYMGHAVRLRTEGTSDPGSFKDSHLLTTQDLLCQIVIRGANPGTWLLVSRCVTVAVALVTVLVLGKCARGSPEAGVLAAALLALHPLHVAQSKVAVPDAHLALFTLLALWTARETVRGCRASLLFLSALCVGLAAAAKYNGAFVGVAPGLALVLVGVRGPARRWGVLVIALAAGAGLGYAIGNPYAVLHPKHLYIGLAYIHSLAERVHFWQEPGSALREYCSVLGPEVGLAGLLGGIALWFRSPSEERRALIPEIAFVAIVFVYMAHAPLHFPRFILPIVPPLCLYASWGCVTLVSALVTGKRARRAALLACFALLTARGACAVAQTELRKGRGDTQVQVSRWAEANLPEGTRVASEWNGIRTPGIDDLEAWGLRGAQLREALAPFEGKGLRIERLPWSVGEHPPAWYRERGVEYIVENGEIRDRVFRDPSLHDMQRNYLEVESECGRIARFEPRDSQGRPIDGPVIDVRRVR